MVSMPIGQNFANATFIFIPFSIALNCSNLFLIYEYDAVKQLNP